MNSIVKMISQWGCWVSQGKKNPTVLAHKTYSNVHLVTAHHHLSLVSIKTLYKALSVQMAATSDVICSCFPIPLMDTNISRWFSGLLAWNPIATLVYSYCNFNSKTVVHQNEWFFLNHRNLSLTHMTTMVEDKNVNMNAMYYLSSSTHYQVLLSIYSQTANTGFSFPWIHN